MAEHFPHYDSEDLFLCPGQAQALLIKIPSQGVIKLGRICSLFRAQLSTRDQSLSDGNLAHDSGRNQTCGVNISTASSHQLPVKDQQCQMRLTNSVNCNEYTEQGMETTVTNLWLQKLAPFLQQKLHSFLRLISSCLQIKLDRFKLARAFEGDIVVCWSRLSNFQEFRELVVTHSDY